MFNETTDLILMAAPDMAMKRWMWQGKETQESIRKTGSKWVGLHAQDNLGSLPACNLF